MNRIWIGHEQNMSWTWLVYRSNSVFKNWIFYFSFSGSFDSKQWFPENLTSIQNISRILAFNQQYFFHDVTKSSKRKVIYFIRSAQWLNETRRGKKNPFLQSIEKWYQITMPYFYCSLLIGLTRTDIFLRIPARY